MDVLNLHSSDGRFVRTFHIRNLREHEGKGEFIAAGDPVDRNEAEKLVGLSILVDREERFPLPEGEFWVDDLIGLQVQDTEGNPLGEVVDFLSAGGNEIYAVRDEKGSLHYIPAVEEFVKDIDLASETMVVKLIEGLW
jgi:16S rRNA processing protein RimM